MLKSFREKIKIGKVVRETFKLNLVNQKKTCEANPEGENSSFILQSASNQFHFIILSLPMQFYIWLSKNLSKPTSKNGEVSC